MKNFEVSAVIPASANEIYESWLDGDKHTAMTGGAATGNAEVGGEFTAWDGYISGNNVELVSGQKIVQNWRTTEFPEGTADSKIEVLLNEVEGGTEVKLIHTDIPDHQSDYEQGWHDHYFEPMKNYFGS